MTDNIVEAVFAGRRSARTRAVYQYDYGMILRPIGLELPNTYEVHFGTSATGPTTTQLGNADGVTVPDVYLQSGSSVYAYIYLHSGEDDGETVYSIVIPVIARGAITDEQPTPVEQGIIEQAIAALNSGVETVEQIAEGIPEQIDAALAYAKASGEFDGAQGPAGEQGPQGVPGQPGSPGADGYSPTVTVQDIAGGHRVTITDAEGDHVFDVMDGQGGGGTSDYSDLTNKPQINGVTLTGNRSLSELGIAAASDIPDVSGFYTKPASGIPASDLAQAVQTSLGKADTALQTAPVSSVNNKTGAVVLTASDVGAGTYSKPSGGIPASDLAAGIVTVTETISGTTPSITAQANTRYICGEVASISITPPSSGICDIVFISGTTPAVLTIPSTVKWPSWFDPDSLDASTTYELNIMDGTLGAVMAWA